MKYDCSSCGSRIGTEMVENYDKHYFEEELRLCRNCIENPPMRIQELFDKIAKGLSEENREEFLEMEISMKSAVAMHMIDKRVIKGGTVGHIETLRAITASKI